MDCWTVPAWITSGQYSLGNAPREVLGILRPIFSGFHVGLFGWKKNCHPKHGGAEGMQRCMGICFWIFRVMQWPPVYLHFCIHPSLEGLWTLLHPLFLWQLPQGRELRVLPFGTQRTQVEVGQGAKKKILKLFWCVFLSLCEGSTKSWKSLSRILQRFSVVKKSCFQRRHCQRIWSAKKNRQNPLNFESRIRRHLPAAVCSILCVHLQSCSNVLTIYIWILWGGQYY